MEPRLLVNNYNENIIKLIQSSEGSERFERKLQSKDGKEQVKILVFNDLIDSWIFSISELLFVKKAIFFFLDFKYFKIKNRKSDELSTLNLLNSFLKTKSSRPFITNRNQIF